MLSKLDKTIKRTRQVIWATLGAAVLLAAYGCQTADVSSATPNGASGVAEKPAVHSEGEACHTSPSRASFGEAGAAVAAKPAAAGSAASTDGMVLIPGGTYQMGTNEGMPYEAPRHEVAIDAFYIDAREVTVAEFRRFVEATNYKTEAEQYGWSGVFDPQVQGWTRVDGANWRHPEGPNSSAAPNEPVTQVSWSDATAYAKWAGKRLPTEAEWERAARGGFTGREYAWGDELRPNGKPVANWWQGHFPTNNTGEDGFKGRAPVGSFAPNGYGLHDVAGNVWEWCADWYADDYYQHSPANNPPGPQRGVERVMRGGSWLCAENFCTNYRVAGRSHSTPDTGLNNLGFRCARDA